jgi:hypothetical protein
VLAALSGCNAARPFWMMSAEAGASHAAPGALGFVAAACLLSRVSPVQSSAGVTEGISRWTVAMVGTQFVHRALFGAGTPCKYLLRWTSCCWRMCRARLPVAGAATNLSGNLRLRLRPTPLCRRASLASVSAGAAAADLY